MAAATSGRGFTTAGGLLESAPQGKRVPRVVAFPQDRDGFQTRPTGSDVYPF